MHFTYICYETQAKEAVTAWGLLFSGDKPGHKPKPKHRSTPKTSLQVTSHESQQVLGPHPLSARHGIRLCLQRKEEGCACLWDDNPIYWASQVALVVKDLPANAGDIRDTGLIPGLRRSPGGGHGNPLQYCLENPRDRGARRATVHGVSKELDTTE